MDEKIKSRKTQMVFDEDFLRRRLKPFTGNPHVHRDLEFKPTWILPLRFQKIFLLNPIQCRRTLTYTAKEVTSGGDCGLP